MALLTGCTIFSARTPSGATVDLIAYGAEVQSASDSERRAIYEAALASHDDAPTATTALRLAIASLGLESASLTDALSLLEYAQISASSDSQRQFVEFLRPMVVLQIDQRRRIESESAARSALEDQLDALKALEELLNSGANGR